MTELLVERMVHGAVGLGRLPSGRLVLVRGALPGELVSVDVTEVAGVLRGEVRAVLAASSDRLPTPAHPGLDYGHISYPRQLELKREVVEDALARAVRKSVPAIPAVRPAPEIWRYRSAIQPVVAGGALGYRVPGGEGARQLDDDPVANWALAAAWRALNAHPLPKGIREIAMRGNDDGEVLLALIATSPQRTLLPFAHRLVQDEVAVGVAYARYDSRGRFRGGSERLAGGRQIEQRYGPLTLTVTVSSFAQPNPAAAARLYEDLAVTAGEGSYAFELFAGSGAIALRLAQNFDRVDAIEIDRSNVTRGEEHARRMGLENLHFHSGDARRTPIPAGARLIAVDPPRSGLAKDIRLTINGSGASRLLYVSCDPATWARDVGHLLELGWALETVTPYDFYPHTHHIELLSMLTR